MYVCLLCTLCVTVVFFHLWLPELYVADFYKAVVNGSGRAWTKPWDVLLCKPRRVGRGQRAAVFSWLYCCFFWRRWAIVPQKTIIDTPRWWWVGRNTKSKSLQFCNKVYFLQPVQTFHHSGLFFILILGRTNERRTFSLFFVYPLGSFFFSIVFITVNGRMT